MKPALKVVYAPKKTAGELRRIARTLRFPVDRLLSKSTVQAMKRILEDK